MRLSLCLLAVAVVGCTRPDPATPAPPETTEEVPDGQESRPTLQQALLEIYGPDSGEVRYFSGEADLNGDGRQEVVVHVVGPLICGSGGCNTLVFTPDGGGLRRVADVSITRPPIVAAQTQTNGWRDLVVDTGGGGAPGAHSLLAFDGTSYPSNPTVEPARTVEGEVPGDVLIAPFDSFTDGEILREER